MAFDQSTRFLQMSLPGVDPLYVTSFAGREEISRLFHFNLDLISDKPGDVTVEKIVGKRISFSVANAENERRWFDGFVSRFEVGDEEKKKKGKVGNFQVEVVPWLWFLTQTSDCRIFQDKTVKEIVEQIFKDLSFSDYEFQIGEGYRKWEYCVQYRETDFNFVSRMLEEEGIFYFFKHEQGKHTLVLCDSTAAYQPGPNADLDCPTDYGGYSQTDHLKDWEHQYEYHSGKWAQTDYNFKTPQTDLMSKTNVRGDISLDKIDKYEIYDYPGSFREKDKGKSLVDIRMQEEEVSYEEVDASGNCCDLSPGTTFSVGKHRQSAVNGKAFLVTSIQHSASEPRSYESGQGGGEGYSNSFSCIPEAVLFRPARITPKPIVQGIQTAVIVGPKGEEIHCDKYGRVKVQFHWDREGKKDEKSSCWIRTAHNIAGKEWGFQAIPRIGQEVVVDFLEGDPDCPLIVGSVYNADQMPHYKLPDLKTRSYIKTNSTKGGDGYNELMFDDKQDDERVFIHSQKNMDVRVRNDSKARIFGNRYQIIGWEKDGDKGGDQREMVYEDKHLNIKKDHIEHIEGNMQMMVGNGEAESGGDLDIFIEKNRKENIGENVSLTVGGDIQEKSGKNIAVEAGQDIYVKSGMNIVIESGVQISLVCGGNYIDIGPTGITIKGTMVTVEGAMVKINSGPGGQPAKGKPCKPEAPKEASPQQPAMAFNSKTGMKSAPD